MSDLTEEERKRLAVQVDYFVETVCRRYDVEPREIMETMIWLREHRKFMDNLQRGASLTLIAMLVTALGTAVWEGIKSFLAGRP